jgi:hypothetical protein
MTMEKTVAKRNANVEFFSLKSENCVARRRRHSLNRVR